MKRMSMTKVIILLVLLYLNSMAFVAIINKTSTKDLLADAVLTGVFILIVIAIDVLAFKLLFKTKQS